MLFVTLLSDVEVIFTSPGQLLYINEKRIDEKSIPMTAMYIEFIKNNNKDIANNTEECIKNKKIFPEILINFGDSNTI